MSGRCSPTSWFETDEPSFDEVGDSREPSRHHPFYFEDGTVVLRMQNTLFKIHQHFLTRHSPVFKDLFTLNNPSSDEGMDDDHPIFLPGDDPVDFCRLLHVFYRDDPIKIPNFTAEQWLSVLVFSTKYDMATIRESTIEQLQIVSPRLDPIRQIVAARKFDCAVLVDEPIQALVTRAERLTLEEMGSLPIADLHAIVDRREGRAGFRCSWCSCTSNRCNNCGRSPSSLPPVDF